MKFRLFLALINLILLVATVHADSKEVFVVDPKVKTILKLPLPERIDSIASYFSSSSLLAPQKIKIWNEQLSLLAKEAKLENAAVLLNLASEYKEILQNDKAEELCLDIFQLVPENSRIEAPWQNILGKANSFLAKGYFEREAWKQSETSCLKAIKNFEALNDTLSLSLAYYGLGLALIQQNLFEEAVVELQKSCDIFDVENKVGHLDAQYNLLLAKIAIEKNKRLLPNLDSLVSKMETTEHPQYSDALLTYGDLLSHLSKFNDAEEVYMIAHNFAIENKNWSSLKKISSKIAVLHEGNNNLDKALEYRKILQVYADSFHVAQSLAHAKKSNEEFESFRSENLLMQAKYEQLLAESNAKLEANRQFINAFLLLSLLAIGLLSYFLMRRVNSKIESKEAEVDSIKEKLFQTVAHEIKKPAKESKDQIERLKNEQLPEHVGQIVASTDRAISGLLAHVNTLIDWNKATSNSTTVKLSTQNYPTAIQNIFDAAKLPFKEKDIIWLLDIIPEKLLCELDFENLEKAVSILLANAANEVSAGAIVSLTSRIVNENLLRIDIKDNGLGIPPNKAEKLFTWKYSPESFSSKESNAFEINMDLTAKLVELMNGSLSFVNNNQLGTHFSILLPFKFVKERQIVADLVSKPRKFPSVLLKQEEDRPNILLIEDHIEYSNFISDTLSDHYNVSIAHDPRIGLAISYKEIPDLIICDIILSKFDNAEIYEKLKNNILTDHIPVILFSSTKEEEEKYAAITQTKDKYLVKPFGSQVLLDVVKEILDSTSKIDLAKKLIEIGEGKELTNFEMRMISVIENNYQKSDFSAEQFADQLNMSKGQMLKKMKSMYHDNPTKILSQYRLIKAKQYLESSSFTVSEIAQKCGFRNTEYFVTVYKDNFKIDPNDLVS